MLYSSRWWIQYSHSVCIVVMQCSCCIVQLDIVFALCVHSCDEVFFMQYSTQWDIVFTLYMHSGDEVFVLYSH